MTRSVDLEQLIAQHRRRFAAEYASGTEPPLHPDHCGPCDDCAAFLAEQRLDAHQRRYPGAASIPTLQEFIRHAHVFRPDCVVVTARGMLTASELAKLETEITVLGGGDGQPKRRQRRTTEMLRNQVLDLDKRGMVAAAIADVMNISDRRVREFLGKSRTSENGGQKRPVQAKLFAA